MSLTFKFIGCILVGAFGAYFFHAIPWQLGMGIGAIAGWCLAAELFH